MKTVIGLFDTTADAYSAQNELLAAGIARGRMSIVTSEANRDYRHSLHLDPPAETQAAEGAAEGAATGAVAGGAVGVLASLGLLLVPGIGSLLALGPILAVLASAGVGAAAGGLIGGLVGLGIPNQEAEIFAEGVNRGGTLVAVDAADRDADRIAIILSQHGAIDIDKRAVEWEVTGWKRQYPQRPPTDEKKEPSSGIDPKKRGDDRKVDVDSLDMDQSLDILDRPPPQHSVRIYHPH